MRYFKAPFFLSFVSVFLLLGCTTAPYDYSALVEAKPRSILVIPPLNNSVEVNAPYIYLSTISRPLGEKGYYVFPVSVIDNFLKENGLPTPGEMNNVPLDKLREHTGADAVLYITIDDWGQKYQVLASKTIVSAKLKLIDARTETLLWESTAYGERSSDNGNNGILGALVAAVVEQVIATTMVDYTPDVARTANNSAINNISTGLLNGPYKPAEQ